MTKKAKPSKQSEKEHRPFRFQSLHERLNNININVVHRIRYHDTIDLQDNQDLIRSSHFHHSLEHWSTLNFSEAYSTLLKTLLPLSNSLEQVVYNREKILLLIHQSLNEHNPLIIETLLDLIVQLARDLQGDFYIYYKQYLFIDIINLLTNTKIQQLEMNTQLLEQIFQCLTYLFKYLWRIMLKDLANLYELYSKYLFSSSLTTNLEYIRSFAAESFAYLLRKIENYQSFIDYLFDIKQCDENELESLALVFSETCQNVQSTFHSCTKSLLSCLLNKLIEKPDKIQSCIKNIYLLLIEHTNKENVKILWDCLMENYRRITKDDISIPFYELFQLLIDHKMIIEVNLCLEFLTMMKTNNKNEEFLKVHYETVGKVMKYIPVNKQIIDIYYRFVDQTSSDILYQEARKIFQSDLYEKLLNEFDFSLWDCLLEKINDQDEIINYFVDFIIIERKKLNMILLASDNDENVLEKIELLNKKKKFLIKEKITEKGLQVIQMFIQETLANMKDINILSSGQLWRALILLNSLPDKDSKTSPFTTTHLENLSSQLITNPISSTTIALTLLELISHHHSFSTSFWYSLLEQENQSEHYLLCTRISFLLQNPSNDHSDKFIELLKKNLSSFNSHIRLLSLHILSSFISDKSNKSNLILNCLSCEECPLNVYEYRSRIIYLQKLSVDFLLTNNNSSSFHLSMYYLLGILCSNFTPLWSISIELLGSYGNKAIEHIGHTYFWSILNEKFQLIKQHNELKPSEQISDDLITSYLQYEDKKEYEINEQSIDYIQYRINLFQVLNYFPNECEQKTKILFPIIFDFFSDEYYDHLLSLGLFGKHKSSYIIELPSNHSTRLSRKFSIKTLENILNLLKQFHHIDQWFEPLRLYQFYVRLLLSSDNSIQRLAYQCLLTCTKLSQSNIQKDFLSHSDEILPLFNPSTCRKTFHELIQGVLLEQNLSDSLKSQYGFLLIRIVYSKLNDKRSLGSTTRGRKDYLELNRKYLFQFLITFASKNLYEEHFRFFIQLLLEPFYDELISNPWLDIFNKKINIHVEEFNLISYEVFIKYIQHSLLLLKTLISKLGVYIHKHVEDIMKFYILTIKFVEYLSERKGYEENFQVKKNRILLKRIRSMGYKGLQTVFQLFDNDENEIFKKDLMDSLWLCCVRENYLEDLLKKNKQREDIIHLLKLVVVWSSTKYLRYTILGERNDAKDLVKYFIGLLNENTTNENKQLIVEFVWNIMQIDPDDPLIIPHNAQLLAYLTRVSSSMINSKSSISLSPKEFDILLILSSKPSIGDVPDQLCSIFLRLLRQNVLSKKSKKTSQQDLNLSILKVLQNLILNIDNPIEKYLPLLTILCCKIIQRDQRIELIKLVQILINQSTTTNSSTIWCLKQLIELNSWNCEQIDEPDYERRLNSYKEITNLKDINQDKTEYLCLFYHCLYEIQYSINDLSLREYASQCIQLFLKQISSYQIYLLTEIRAILKQSAISIHIRHEFLRHLSFIIDINIDNEDLIDLKRLRNSVDIELDFFHNITHVQNHRRLRALKRLKIIHDEQPFQCSTINNYLLPMVCSFINDVINEETQDINDEIVFVCLTMLSRRLTWNKYNQLFISYFRQLTISKRVLNLTQKRCLTKTISAIIDAFHFQLDVNNEESQRISRTIQKRLLPMILDLLSQNSFSIDSLTTSGVAAKNATIDDQRQQAVLLTITCSLISIKLIVIFPHDFIEQYISTVLLHLITLLRSRLYSIRDQARDCLCKCITILGKRYFKYIIEELISGLQRGYQHFVLLHTIHNILIHISSLPNDFNIDSAVKILAKLFLDDLFNAEKTESSKANEHENSSYKPSNIPEAKTNKSANVMELLGRLIHSNDELLTCINPLREQLSLNNDSRQISKCEKSLQRFQIGLINNQHLSIEYLFIFIYHLLTKTEENQESNLENKKFNLALEERNKYHLIPAEPKRGHARVALAIKHGKKTNIHCLIAWTLNLLHKLVKKHKNEDEKFLSMIDPFIVHIEVCLNSQYTDVIVAALRNLSSLLEYALPSLNKERVTNMYKKVFDLLKMYSSVAGSTDMNDLLTLSYKILGTFVQRSTTDDISLTSDEYQCLFTYIESDLLNVHRQSSAFLLLRSIMRHSVSIITSDKNLRIQLDNLLRSRLMFMIVQSPYDHIRTICRDLFHIYLFSYEHSKTKLKSYFDFFLLQLDYEDYNGRLSVLTFLTNLFNDLTKQRLNDYASYFFLPLSCHYYNETNNECKKCFQFNLRLLLEKIDAQNRNDILKNIVFIWMNDQIEHRCLAIQLFTLFIEIEHEQFDQYLLEIFQFMEKEFEEINQDNDHEQQKFNDQYIYHLINVLVYVIKYCPNSVPMGQLRSKWLRLLKLVDEKCLLHPHIWVRFLSAQFFGLLFEMNKPADIVQHLNKYLSQGNNSSISSTTTENGPTPKRLKKSLQSNLDTEPLFVHYVTTFDPSISPLTKIKRLCLCSSSQLKPLNLTEEFCLVITKNLIYLSKLLILSNSTELNLVVQRCCRLTTFESTKHPSEITRRSSVLKWIAALVLDSSSSSSSSLTLHLKSFLTVIEREIERDETTPLNLSLKTLAQDVFDVVKRNCDIHLITSIYADIAKQQRIKRSERKQKLAVLAINQPEIAYRKKRVKQTKRLGAGKKKRIKAIENAKKSRRKKIINKPSEDIDDF